MPATILGLAHALPPEAAVAGVRRPIATDPVGPSDLALLPARMALEQAGDTPEGAELIIFATMTPDVTFPGSACYLQHKLGAGTIGALDIRGQCAGFVMGLLIAQGFLDSGMYRRVLLAAGEVHSAGLDYSERGARVAALYGDGAAAAVLGNAPGTGIEAVICRTDGRLHDRFWVEYPASRQHPVRFTVDNFEAGGHFPQIDFDVVATFGREHLESVVRETLAQAGVTIDQIDCLFLSHLLPEVGEGVASVLGIPSSRFVNASAAHGHVTAASLPVVLSEARAAGRVGAGDRVCVAACGAGFAWGAAVLTL